jgi:hypothetical protein
MFVWHIVCDQCGFDASEADDVAAHFENNPDHTGHVVIKNS